jgi:hypothetical protein
MAAPEGVVIVPENVPGVSACITGTQISRSKTNSFENRLSMKYLKEPPKWRLSMLKENFCVGLNKIDSKVWICSQWECHRIH